MGAEFIEGFEIGLGDEIGNLLQSGEWQRANPPAPVMSGNWAEAAGGRSAPDRTFVENKTAVLEKLNFIENHVFKKFFSEEHAMSGQEEERAFLEFFKSGKTKRLENLALYPTQNSRVQSQIVETTTIREAHRFSEYQFDYFSRAKGKELIGSGKFIELAKEADYWLKAEQVARGAVEFSIRNRLNI
jgi:hypothetical protein